MLQNPFFQTQFFHQNVATVLTYPQDPEIISEIKYVVKSCPRTLWLSINHHFDRKIAFEKKNT